MAPTNDFLPFCPTDTGSNLLNESDYTASADRVSGNKPGVASSKLSNKAIRQANAITSQIAQLVANATGADVVDDANSTKLLAQINAALTPFAPNVTRMTSSSGNFNPTYIFCVSSANATVGATYTNNAVTFTVGATIAAGLFLKASGSGAPAVSGTLTKASGTGDATITFYAVRAPLYAIVEAVGGGAGGGPSGIGGGGSLGTDGNDTTFGAFITAGKGLKGPLASSNGGAGGSNTISSPGIALRNVAGQEGGGSQFVGSNGYGFGAAGGSTPLGCGGPMTGNGAVGRPANANSGGGGAGGDCNNITSAYGGTGGGGGGYVLVQVPTPSGTYAWVVGAGGTGGTNGSALAGGNGGSGVIEVSEHYQ